MNIKNSILRISKTFLFAFLFACLFSGCDYIVDGDDTTYSIKPTVEALSGDKSGIEIAARWRSKTTDYIYIYRIVVPASDSTETPVEENIGIINQNGFKLQNTYLFQDQFVTAGTTYKYKTIYHNSEEDEYYISSWSDKITATSGFGPLVYDTSTTPTTVVYSNVNSTLTSDKDISAMKFASPNAEQTDYYPTLVLNNGSYSRYFPITDGTVTNLTYINLRDLVSDDFVNIPLTIPGLVGMKIEYTTAGALASDDSETESTEEADAEVIQRIYFSSAFDITSTISMPDDVTEIQITTFQGTGIYLPE